MVALPPIAMGRLAVSEHSSSTSWSTYLEIAGLGLSTGQSLADAMRQVLGLAARDGADGLFLELDRHDGCGMVGPRGWEASRDGLGIPGTPASGEAIKW